MHMSITDLRTAVTTAGGTPTRFDQVSLYRELVTAWGGTPSHWTVPNLLRELVTLAGGTPTMWDQVGLLRQLVTARGGTPATFYPDALEAQVALLASLGPSYGPELIVNGDFSAVGAWVAVGGWTVDTTAGKGVGTGATDSMIYPGIMTPGTTYAFTMAYTMSSGANLRVNAGNITTSDPLAASGTFSGTVLCGVGNTDFRIQAAGAVFTGTVDNVSVKAIL